MERPPGGGRPDTLARRPSAFLPQTVQMVFCRDLPTPVLSVGDDGRVGSASGARRLAAGCGERGGKSSAPPRLVEQWGLDVRPHDGRAYSTTSCGRTRLFKMAVKHLLAFSFAHLVSLHLEVRAGNRRCFTLSGRIRVITSFSFARISHHVFFTLEPPMVPMWCR